MSFKDAMKRTAAHGRTAESRKTNKKSQTESLASHRLRIRQDGKEASAKGLNIAARRQQLAKEETCDVGGMARSWLLPC